MDFAQKVILITGASEGIGAACAGLFHGKGAQLALVARNEARLRQVGGPDDLRIPADLRDDAARRRVVEETLARFGRVDILLNNAGIGVYTPTRKLPIEEVRAMMELNYYAPLDLIQRVIPSMRGRRQGLIVNVSSLAGKLPLPWFTTYTASKYALSALTDGLRVELKQYGIRLMSVCPGYVSTAFQSNVIGGRPPARLWRMRGFAISPEQCARAIVRGVERGKRTVVTPWVGRPAILLNALFPRLAEAILQRVYNGLEME